VLSERKTFWTTFNQSKVFGKAAEVVKVASRCSWPGKYLCDSSKGGRNLIKEQTRRERDRERERKVLFSL